MATRVAKTLGFQHVSAGDFMREMAEERGLSILELSRSAEARGDIDREIDARTVRLGQDRDDFVIDARLGWHFLPQSIKIFLEVRPEVAAARIYGAKRGSERENTDLEATLRAIESRTASEVRRYREYYDVDYGAHDHYDLVIDTSELAIADVADRIVGYLSLRNLERKPH